MSLVGSQQFLNFAKGFKGTQQQVAPQEQNAAAAFGLIKNLLAKQNEAQYTPPVINKGSLYKYHYSPMSPSGNQEQMLSRLYEGRWQNFQSNYKPLLDNLASDTNSRALVQEAAKQVGQLPEQLKEMSARNQSRFAGGLTAAQRLQVAQTQDNLGGLSAASSLNQARGLQRQRNESLTGDLMQISEDMMTKGTANLTQFAANEQQRRQMAAQNKSSGLGQLLSLGGAVVGGMMGGPAGAQMGAGIGGMAGSYF